MGPIPFLYLPDAVSLALLFAALELLRRSAVDHVRQVSIGIRNEMLAYWMREGLPLSHPAYVRLRRQIDTSIRCADKVTPARLYFVSRWFRNAARCEDQSGFTDALAGLRRPTLDIEDTRVRDKVRRFDLELNASLGIFFLTASISGWILLLPILLRMIKRVARRRPKSRVDLFFDLAERILSRLGRRALTLAILLEAHPAGIS